jgi:DnaK suppressor protein
LASSKTAQLHAQIRRELTTRREQLAAELRQSTAEFISDEPNYTDSIDQAAAESDKTITLQIKNRGRDLLVQIDEALRRIDSGSFGCCELCEEEISEGRIKAFPLTTLCIDCKAELESEGLRYQSRV